MSLVSPTLSLEGPVQGAQGTRRGSQGWGCHGEGRRTRPVVCTEASIRMEVEQPKIYQCHHNLLHQ